MPRKPKTPTPDPAEAVSNALTDAQREMAGRRLMAEHRRLKVAFADTYVELIGLREESTRLNEIIQEQQRVIREMSAKLPKDKPKA